MNRIVLLHALFLLAATTLHAGENAAFYEEVNAIIGYSEEEGWIGEKDMHLKNSAGFEWFKKFSNDFGDFLTADLQVRLSYDSSHASDEDWAIEIHNAWAEYKVGLGKNVRLGHFSPAFGLEPTVDTHGTLFQTLAGRDIGFKKDWGAGYRSVLGFLDYEIAAQIGSGMGIEQKDGSYLATARTGNPPNRNLQYGLSVLSGEVLESGEMRTIPKPEFADQAVSKQRIGADAQYLVGPFQLMAEISLGRNETNDVVGALLEIDYTVPSFQAVTLKAQGRFWTDDPDDSERNLSEVGAGASWRLGQSWTVRAGIFHDLEKPGTAEDTRAFVQVYYFGG